ncbi:hypothetical protein [Halovivax limisalsi]|uniref:hypothetical protein n=1 Tax=Halovivax limisalsi TaxID=1453760 RepID=UPI001FFD3E6F|nr:hypothetical protein [Halovivax limisalsi]
MALDWRVIVAGFVVSVGLGLGWRETETVTGAVFTGVFGSVLFVLGWVIDTYLYGL